MRNLRRSQRAADALDALRHVSGKTILTPEDVRYLEAAQKKRDRKATRRAKQKGEKPRVVLA